MEQSNVFRFTQFKITIFEGLRFKLQCRKCDFVKFLAQIINIFSKFWQK